MSPETEIDLYNRHTHCWVKTVHFTRDHARKEAKRMKRKYCCNFKVYRCRYCNNYHVGRTYEQKREGVVVV